MPNMLRFIIRRLFYIVLVLFIVAFFIFWLYRSMPGNPALIFMQGREMDMTPAEFQEALARLEAELGLDQPLVVQFFIWVGQVLRGELGYSFQTRMSVMDTIRLPMLNTIVLSIVNLVLVFAITVPVGIYAAIKRGKLFDNAALVSSMLGFSAPTFLVGMAFIVIFAVWLQLLPTGGMASVMAPEFPSFAWLMDRARFAALPLMTLVFVSTAGLIRFVRSAMVDALHMDFVRTARAKGVKEKAVIYSHAFRNALIPVITIMTGWFIGIFGGSVVVESVFNWMGMGRLMIQSLMFQDLAILKALSVFFSFVSFVGLLLMDITYVIVDPRIRFD